MSQNLRGKNIQQNISKLNPTMYENNEKALPYSYSKQDCLITGRTTDT